MRRFAHILPPLLLSLLPLLAATGGARAQQVPPAAPDLRLPGSAAPQATASAGASPATNRIGDGQRRATPRHASRTAASALPSPPALPALRTPPAIPALATGSISAPAPITASGTPPRAPRPRPASTDGLRLGAFMLRGETETGIVYSSRRGSRGRHAIGARLAPNLRLVSNWPRHELAFSANGTFIAWNRGGNEARGNLGAALRLDARRDTRLRLAVDYAVDEADSGNATSTALQHEVDASATLEHQRYRLTAALTGGALLHLEPGKTLDYIQPHAAARLRLRTAPALAVYGEVGADARRFRKAGRSSDSVGGHAEAGVELLRGPIWEGRLGVRGELRHYRDKTRKNLVGVGVNGNLAWRPARQTDIGLETAFNLQDDASGPTRRQTVALSWRQQLRHSLELRTRLEGEYDDVKGGADNSTLRASASLAWQIWRKLWITASYDVERDYTGLLKGPKAPAEHRLGLGLRHRF